MEFLEFLQENLFTIITGFSITAFLGLLYNRFVHSVIPKILRWLNKLIIKVISNAFGFDVDENAELMEKLPFINKFEKLAEDIELQNQLKLIEYKQKLASPIYTAVEKIPIEKIYNALYYKLRERLPQDIIDALEMLDNLSKDE